jgi:hypothetical protein
LAYQPPDSNTFISEKTSNQPVVLFSQNKSAPATSQMKTIQGKKASYRKGKNLLDTKCLQHDEFTGKKASRDIQFHLAIWLISS